MTVSGTIVGFGAVVRRGWAALAWLGALLLLYHFLGEVAGRRGWFY